MSYFRVYPCLLCGTIHDIVILCYPKRKWRTPEDGQDYTIKIICIICYKAKAEGKQYTKRILPEFLRPYCRIRLDLSLEYYRTHYTGTGTYDLEDACTALGCIDKRTAKRHLSDLQATIPGINLELSQILAHKSGFITQRQITPDTRPAELLDILLAQVNEYHCLLYGNLPPVSPHFFSALMLTHAWFCGFKLSTSYVEKAPAYHDTS